MNLLDEQKTYFIEAYGCQMNFYDADLIASILEEGGYRPAGDVSQSDVIVVNTCSVRDHAERRAIGRIRELAGLKKNIPQARLVVCGCMAQRLGQDLLQLIPGVDLVVGTDAYAHLPELLERTHGARLTATISCAGTLYSQFMPRHPGGPTAFVAVMRGCDNSCAYCIVPYLRGPARSRPLSDILREVNALVEKGIREITFLGQNVNAYRDGKNRFPDLLRRVGQVEGLWRIRFTTSHPKDMDENILRAIAESPKVCEHLHLPLQSGSDRILRAMRRGYSIQKYRSLVAQAREILPGMSITTDVIAGFPGETDEDFHQTLEMMRFVEFDDAFTFQYSQRPGTEAADMPQQVPIQIRHQRLRQLIDLQRQITRQVTQRLMGRTVEVLAERLSKRDDQELMGKTRTQKVVVFPGKATLLGQLVQIQVCGLRGGTARGMVSPAVKMETTVPDGLD